MKSQKTLLSILLLLAVILSAWWLIRSKDTRNIACPADAMICNDGSSVGRTGPDCSFAACPTTGESIIDIGGDGWTTYTDPGLGFSIRYPSQWFHVESENGVLLTPLAPDDPKRSSGIGLASSLSIKKISEEQLSVIEELSSTTENIEINGVQGTLFLTPNAYAGGFNRSYVISLFGQTYIQAYFYDGEMDAKKYPFEKMVETLQIQ